MSDRTLGRWGSVLAGISVALALFAVVTLAVLRPEGLFEFGAMHNVLLALGLGSLLWVTMSTQARNGAVWALGFAGFFAALQSAGFAAFVLVAPAPMRELTEPQLLAMSPSDLPAPAAIAMQTALVAWIPAFFLVLTLGLLLFPDGRLPSPRWRWVGWLSVAAIAWLVMYGAWVLRPSSTFRFDGEPPSQYLVGFVALFVAVAASIGALIVRYRRSSGATRHQIRWIAWGGALLAAMMLVVVVNDETGAVRLHEGLANLLPAAAEMLLIASFAVAITRYRLYDIDVVISRTVTYGALAVFITVVYVAIVVGLGTLGQREEPNLALAIAATAAVALLFQPVRSLLQRWANRLVYGERATPYAVLAELTARFSEAESNEQGLDRLAELVASGTGADAVVVWVRVGDRLRPEASTMAEPPAAVEMDDDELPELVGDAAAPIRHGGELLGALSIRKHRGDPFTPSDRRLLEDVAAGAGLLLRNIRLNAELADRAAEIRSSRRRLVAAQDSERKRLERNLHDGAQQQVVALKVKLGLATSLARREGVDQVADAVGELADDTQRAVEGMRAAARGIYPPLLEAEGLRPALVAAGRESSTRLQIEADGIGRYPPEIEATVYFCVLEAIRHTSTGALDQVRVGLADGDNKLSFSVSGPGSGSSPGPDLTAIADRLEAVDGTLDVVSSPSGETVVTGHLPARALEPT